MKVINNMNDFHADLRWAEFFFLIKFLSIVLVSEYFQPLYSVRLRNEKNSQEDTLICLSSDQVCNNVYSGFVEYVVHFVSFS